MKFFSISRCLFLGPSFWAKRLLFSLPVLFLFVGPAAGQSDFRRWINDFYQEAASQGISRATFDLAFQGITEPDSEVLRKAAYQPEFTVEVWDYLDARITPLTIASGKQQLRERLRLLDAIEERFAVPRQVLLAIWSMESAYGAILAKPGLLHDLPRALATLAYGDPKRAKFARTQLLAALTILQDAAISREQLRSSWAGAMGHTQFIPTSYLTYRVDMDQNGRCDIWGSVPDALATAANLLSKNGWRSGESWGYEVKTAQALTGLKDQSKTLQQWSALGCIQANGSPLPADDRQAVLKLPAGGSGPSFLMLKNFFVIKRYNNSDSYALAVSLLADRIGGKQGLIQPWPRPPDSLGPEEKLELQRLLQNRSLYSGPIDGNLGSETRTAIRAFQRESGMEENGEPTRQLLKALKH